VLDQTYLMYSWPMQRYIRVSVLYRFLGFDQAIGELWMRSHAETQPLVLAC
jgi:hypothetical protein